MRPFVFRIGNQTQESLTILRRSVQNMFFYFENFPKICLTEIREQFL